MSDLVIPQAARPRADEVAFDLDAALGSVVGLQSEVHEDAFTASVLGTRRAGHGVVIDERGLVLTIGYLVTEAEQIWLTTAAGSAVPGHLMGYDQATGFGLVQALGRLDLPALSFGRAAAAAIGDPVIMAGHGGRAQALKAEIVDKRCFAGYWEYVLDQALFTAPAHPSWSGAACIGEDGRLLGIGSLFLKAEDHDEAPGANMVVPIDLLPPILDDLRTLGRANRPPRPWLGMYTTEYDGALVVAGIAPGGPAERGGVEVGDVVVAVAGERPEDLADLFRRVWARGEAGVEVPLTLLRDGRPLARTLPSIDRATLLRRPSHH